MRMNSLELIDFCRFSKNLRGKSKKEFKTLFKSISFLEDEIKRQRIMKIIKLFICNLILSESIFRNQVTMLLSRNCRLQPGHCRCCSWVLHMINGFRNRVLTPRVAYYQFYCHHLLSVTRGRLTNVPTSIPS